MKSLSYCIALVIALANFITAEKIYDCTEDKTIALTFDDGPFRYSEQLVDYLISKDVTATFFTVGRFHYPFAVDTPEYQNVMKKAHDHGMQIASHTFDHQMYNETDLMRETLTKQDDFIESVTGDRPRYFRAPKGECEQECQDTFESWGYRLIQWNVDTVDYDIKYQSSPELKTEETINNLQTIFAEERYNYLILMHDTENITVSRIVPWIVELSGMKEKGYRFVTVAECLGEKESMYVSGNTYGDDNLTNNHNHENLNNNANSAVRATQAFTMVLYTVAFILLFTLF